MPFASIHFIFLFLPAFLLVYSLIPNRHWKNFFLSIGSFFFFGWADPINIPLLVVVVIINYVYGRLIGSCVEKNKTTTARFHMWSAVIINLLALGFYKYLAFLGETLQALLQIELDVEPQALPLGISYLTFTGIAYILDVYRGMDQAEKNILRFSSYLIMFPKILQGPITRFSQVKDDLLHPRFVTEDVMQGVRRFIAGLAKKVILADRLAIAANKVFDSRPAVIGADLAWFGVIAYSLQIYFDFSGYTDMAIGLGKIIGIKLPENFNFPYISRSITDFWRRWHMTLTSWFRNYVFLPLEYSRKKQVHLRQQTNIFIVFALTGLWHGASWNFVIWGGYFGLILAIEASGWGKRLKRMPTFIQHFYAIALIMIGWIFFRLTNMSNWGPFFSALIGANGWTGLENFRTLNIIFFIPVVLLGIFFSTPLVSRLESKIVTKFPPARIPLDIIYLLLFLLAVSYVLSNGFSAFLYAQF